MYQALYRKYRPKTFSDVVGQDHITKTLKNQIEKNRTTHAYIFTGTRGTGKTSCAKILARAVNCENHLNGDPCNVCKSCISIMNESSMDVSEIDAASNNKVDDIREILEETRYTPTNLKKRVYIIDEVHMLTTQAFNALLKTLEEPPEHVLFILATTEIHKVLPTILSRCQRFDFKRINMQSISQRLIEISQIEGFVLEKDAADIISKMADGGLRDALSILDRCIVSEEKTITADMVCSRVGSIDFTKLIKLINSIISCDTLKSISDINDLYADGIELQAVLEQLLTLSRDMLLFKITQDISFGIIYNISVDEFSEMCDNIVETRLMSFVDNISNTLNIMQKSQNKKIDVELCIIKLCKNISTENVDLQDRINNLEHKIDNFKPQVISQVIAKETKVETQNPEKPKPPKKPSNPEEKGKEDFERWTILLRNLKFIYKNRELIFIRENTKALFYSDKIKVIVDDEITHDLLCGIEKKNQISQKASELFEADIDFELCYKNEQSELERPIDEVLKLAKNKNIQINTLED